MIPQILLALISGWIQRHAQPGREVTVTGIVSVCHEHLRCTSGVQAADQV
jgi:hypothetical protein